MMPQINHFRRWVPPKARSVNDRPVSAFDVNSFLGAVDPEFDDLAKTEEMMVERLRDRGSF